VDCAKWITIIHSPALLTPYLAGGDPSYLQRRTLNPPLKKHIADPEGGGVLVVEAVEATEVEVIKAEAPVAEEDNISKFA
jgi:hypothetical protein